MRKCAIFPQPANTARVAAALTANALTLDMLRQPAAFADREASGDTAIPSVARDNLRRFSLELAFAATPSNNVQVAFGRDAEPLDGKLAAEETAFIIGWDSGECSLSTADVRRCPQMRSTW